MDYGIDLSVHNGAVDFEKLKAAGNSFVILRAGYGWDLSQKDPKFEEYYKQAKAAGLDVGAYYYSYARNEDEAAKEVECLLSWIKDKVFEYPIYIDMEDADAWKGRNGNPSGSMQAQVANVAMPLIEAAGYYAGIYSSQYWFDCYLAGLTENFDRWVASWGKNDGAQYGEFKPMHQYTSEYRLDGKRYDRNVCHVNYPQKIKEAGLNGYRKDDNMAKTPHEIYLDVNGKAFDVDGYFGAQCWDGVMHVNRKYWGGSVHHCGGDGYVHNLWTNRRNNGMLNDFVEVPNVGNAQDGDVFIWKKGAPECPASHIAIFRCWAANTGKTRAVFLGQNQGGYNGAFNQKEIGVAGVLGVFRPKCYVNKAAAPAGINWIAEDGTATFTVDNVRIHKDSPDGPVIPGVTYNRGQSVRYFAKCAYKGHRWVKYHRASGGIGVVAVSNSEKHGVEPWATFK